MPSNYSSVETAPGRGLLHALADSADSWRVERVISVARLVVSIGALLMLQGDPAEWRRWGALAVGLLIVYGGFGLLFLLVLARRWVMPRQLPAIVHAADIGYVAVLALLAKDLSGPLLVGLLLLYPLLTAGYRWGFREVVFTSIALDALLVGERMLIESSLGARLAFSSEPFVGNAFGLTFVAIAGSVVGYLAENENRRRSEAVAVSRIIATARPGAGIDEALGLVLTSVRDIFGARAVVLVLREVRTGRLFRWLTELPSTAEAVKSEEMPREAAGRYLFATPGAAWHAVARRLRRRGRYGIVALDRQGRRVKAADLIVPAAFAAAYPCRRMLGVGLDFGGEWTGVAFVFEPALGIHRDANARFLLRLTTQVGRVMSSNYLGHRVRTRAQAVERGRIARGLHDGIVQSLLGLEMQLVVLRRRVLTEAPQVDEALATFHKVLRNEVTGLREFMEEIRAGDGQTDDMVQELAEIVDRFRRYTGITTNFVSEPLPTLFSLNKRRELARILHEALVNVRKHSNARRVFVSTDVQDGRWRLSIEDNGRGFPFAGRRSRAELDALQQGPRTISQRIGMIGGDMVVESKPGTGARIEITVPMEPS